MSTLKKSKRIWISRRRYWRQFTSMEQGRILWNNVMLVFSSEQIFIPALSVNSLLLRTFLVQVQEECQIKGLNLC